MTEYEKQCMTTKAKELGLKYVAKYADSLYSKDGINGPYFKWNHSKFDFVKIGE